MTHPISSTGNYQASALHSKEAAEMNQASMTHIADKISMRARFNPYECEVLFKKLAKEEHKDKIIKWLALLQTGQKKDVIKQVQQFINQNIRAKDIAKMAFYGTVTKINSMSKKRMALHATKEVLSVPLAPIILSYKVGRVIATKKGRAAAKRGLRGCLKGGAYKGYNARNKMITGVMKASMKLLASALIAASIASAGAATPAIIALGSVAGSAATAKVAHDLSQGKHFALSLVETVGAGLASTTTAALGVGLTDIAELCEILIDGLNTPFQELSEPLTNTFADFSSELSLDNINSDELKETQERSTTHGRGFLLGEVEASVSKTLVEIDVESLTTTEYEYIPGEVAAKASEPPKLYLETVL